MSCGLFVVPSPLVMGTTDPDAIAGDPGSIATDGEPRLIRE
jgi:hypothetical protein